MLPYEVEARNSTVLPPGRNCGQRWEISSGAKSVRGAGFPPSVGTTDRKDNESSSATMVPSSPQVPPRPAGASHNETGSPPSIRVFFSLPPAKKPTHCPSGEKKGA